MPNSAVQHIDLQAIDLYCERDDRELFRDLCFQVKNGDLWQLAGPNGAGKTTLLRILAGLNRDFDGQILWADQNLQSHYEDYARQRLYMGHLSAVKKGLTPIENLRWLTAQESISENRLWQALEDVDLAGYEETPVQYLSAGQQRRVALARLRVTQCSLWILDEPFTALDKQGVAWLEAQLQEHIAQDGAVVITSHHALESLPGLKQLTLGEQQ